MLVLRALGSASSAAERNTSSHAKHVRVFQDLRRLDDIDWRPMPLSRLTNILAADAFPARHRRQSATSPWAILVSLPLPADVRKL